MIEIIIGSDKSHQVEKKIAEYFKAGIKVLWNIIPENQLVYIYISRKNVQICTDDGLCSASPALPDFEIRVNELFAEKTI